MIINSFAYFLRLFCVCFLGYFVLFFGTVAKSTAQNLFTIEQQKALFSLSTDKFKTSITASGALYAHQYNYWCFIKLLIQDEAKLYQDLQPYEEKHLAQVQLYPKNTPEYLFAQSEIKLQWAIIQLKFGHEWAAFQGFRQAYKLAKENHAKFPAYLPQKKTLGFLQILLAAAPENYHWLLSLLGLEGNRQEGWLLLNEVANSQGFYAEEARILWILAKLMVEKQAVEALNKIKEWQWYEPQGKSNTVLHSYLCVWVCIKAHTAKQANLILSNIDKTSNSDKLPLYDYLLAESYFLIGRYVEASQNYLSYLAVYQGNRYIKDAYFKLYAIAEITGQATTATQHKSNILKNGALQTEADRYAQKFAEGKAAGSPKLFRLRFLTDGGEYEQATQWLQQHAVQGFEKGVEQTEYYYRMARLCHLTQQYSQAITHYQQVLSQSYTPKTYFAPNSALQMGLLCMQQLQKKDLAKYYFKKVLDYQDYEYEKGIRYEAQRYLKQL